MGPRLRQAFLVSILAHVALLFSLRHVIPLAEWSAPVAPAAIRVQLGSADSGQASTPPQETLAAPVFQPERPAPGLRAQAVRAGRPTVSPPRSRSTATDDVAVTERAVAMAGRLSEQGAPPSARGEDVSLDGVRQYRLNLAREARRFKDYPSVARERAWEGVVVVVVNTVAGAGVPVVTLSQSSGFDVLDRAALDLVGQAVVTTVMPEGLRGRQFALTLPIHYRLDD